MRWTWASLWMFIMRVERRRFNHIQTPHTQHHCDTQMTCWDVCWHCKTNATFALSRSARLIFGSFGIVCTMEVWLSSVHHVAIVNAYLSDYKLNAEAMDHSEFECKRSAANPMAQQDTYSIYILCVRTMRRSQSTERKHKHTHTQ